MYECEIAFIGKTRRFCTRLSETVPQTRCRPYESAEGVHSVGFILSVCVDVCCWPGHKYSLDIEVFVLRDIFTMCFWGVICAHVFGSQVNGDGDSLTCPHMCVRDRLESAQYLTPIKRVLAPTQKELNVVLDIAAHMNASLTFNTFLSVSAHRSRTYRSESSLLLIAACARFPAAFSCVPVICSIVVERTPHEQPLGVQKNVLFWQWNSASTECVPVDTSCSRTRTLKPTGDNTKLRTTTCTHTKKKKN